MGTLVCVVIVVDMLVARKGGKSDGANVSGIVSENARAANDTGSEAARQRMQLLTDGRPPACCQVVAVVDHLNSEAVCTARILREFLKTHCGTLPSSLRVLLLLLLSLAGLPLLASCFLFFFVWCCSESEDSVI